MCLTVICGGYVVQRICDFELLTVQSVVLTVAGGSPTVHNDEVNLSGEPQTNHC